MKKRTNTYIATIKMTNESEVLTQKKLLESIFGWVTLRGRHSNRKKVLGNAWHTWAQNDIPWRKAEYIDVYLHHANPNRINAQNGLGIKKINNQYK